MKAILVVSLLAVVCPLWVWGDDDDSFELDMENDGLEALMAAMLIGQALNCAQYGRSCMNGGRCCQYMGYSAMSCRNGQCLQTRCYSVGQRCNSVHDCCYHEGLTCYAGTRTCGYDINNGRK